MKPSYKLFPKGGIFLASLLLTVLAGFQTARSQVVNNTPGAPFVYPIPQQMELGPTLDVIPCVLSDGFTVNLTLIPTLTEFTGYDPAPANLQVGGSLGASVILVPAVLPHFTVRQVTSTVNVWDGQTVVLGGLISDNTTSSKDKVPVLGDMPVVGRLFRSELKTTVKKNLMIFVTPTIVDPAGNRMHALDEMPFAQSSIPVQPVPVLTAPMMPAAATPPPAVPPAPAPATP